MPLSQQGTLTDRATRTTVGPVQDVWALGPQYEAYMGRWSRPLAVEVVRCLGLPQGLSWLDVGCGTGALTTALLAGAAPARVLGVDPSAGFVASARAGTSDPRASFAVGDATALPVPDGDVDVVVSGLVLNFVDEPRAAVAEAARAVRPGGTVAAYVWDHAGGGMQMMRLFWDAAGDLDPEARPLHEAARFPGVLPGPLRAMFTAAGLVQVVVEPVVVPTPFSGLDDVWLPLLGGQGSAPGYVATLDEEARAELREELGRRLPVGPDGVARLTGKAWLARGTRPATAS